MITIFHDLKCFTCEQGFLALVKAVVFNFFHGSSSDTVSNNFPAISEQTVLIDDLCLTPYIVYVLNLSSFVYVNSVFITIVLILKFRTKLKKPFLPLVNQIRNKVLKLQNV